jgi:sulfatase maturation enzyme AslB (radical SAM superfamily)
MDYRRQHPDKWVMLHQRTLLRDDFPKGHPILAFNAPKGGEDEKLSRAELELLLWLVEPRPLARAVGRYGEIAGLSLERSHKEFQQRFVESNLLREGRGPAPLGALNTQDHLSIQPPGSCRQTPRRSPSHIYLELTQACNLKCLHCFASESGSLATLPTGLVFNLLDQMHEAGVLALTVSGGEPAMHPDFAAILQRAAGFRFSVSLLTNGTLFGDESSLDLLTHIHRHENRELRVEVSLDGFEAKTHDRIRGKDGAFAQAKRSIEYLAAKGMGNLSVEMVLYNFNFNQMAPW